MVLRDGLEPPSPDYKTGILAFVITEHKLGVLDGERSHTIAFTERGADHYTTNTIELAGPLRIELRTTESKSVVIPFNYEPTENT